MTKSQRNRRKFELNILHISTPYKSSFFCDTNGKTRVPAWSPGFCPSALWMRGRRSDSWNSGEAPFIFSNKNSTLCVPTQYQDHPPTHPTIQPNECLRNIRTNLDNFMGKPWSKWMISYKSFEVKKQPILKQNVLSHPKTSFLPFHHPRAVLTSGERPIGNVTQSPSPTKASSSPSH